MLHPEVTGYLRVGLAGTIHGDAGDVEDFLIGFPQKRHQERRATSGLIYRPDDLLGERESVVYEPRDVRLVVFDPPGEELCARSVQHVSPVEFFAGVYASQAWSIITFIACSPLLALGEPRRQLPT